MPALAAFSIEYNWLALYYYNIPHGYLRLYKYDTRKLYAECMVEPVYQQDAIHTALFASEDKKSVVIRSGGIDHMWDTETLMWSKYVKDEGHSEMPIKDIRYSYAKRMLKNQTLTKPKYSKLLKRLLNSLSKIIHFLPRISACMNRAELTARSIENVPIICQGQQYWILNQVNGTVHICNKDGEYLCHEEFGFPVAAFDICGDILYVLPEDLSEAKMRKLKIL